MANKSEEARAYSVEGNRTVTSQTAVTGHFTGRHVVENFPAAAQPDEPAANTGALHRLQLMKFH